MGQLRVLNGKGDEVVTEDLRVVAMRLLEEGYRFWHNAGTDKAIVLGDTVVAKKITDQMTLVAMKPLAGG